MSDEVTQVQPEQATEETRDITSTEEVVKTESEIIAEAVAQAEAEEIAQAAPQKQVEPEDGMTISVNEQMRKAEEERKELRLAQMAQELQQNKQMLQEQAKFLQEMKELEQLKAQDPEAFLERVGINYDDIIRRRLGQTDPTPEEIQQQTVGQIEALKQEIETLRQQDIQRQNQKAASWYQDQVRELAKQHPWIAKYEELNNADIGDICLDLNRDFYANNNKPLQAEEALSYFVNEFRAKWEPLLNSNHSQQATIPHQTQTPQEPVNLTNNQTPSTPNQTPLSELSFEERQYKLAQLLDKLDDDEFVKLS
jgi:hypothetical protein